MRADEIVGYSFRADIYCPEDTADAVARYVDRQFGLYAGKMAYETVEEYLGRVAGHLGIDRYDERTFDSDEFPKVIFPNMADSEYCGTCLQQLLV